MINITKIIKDNHFESHRELQLHLRELSNAQHYWNWEQAKKQWLIDKGIMKYCELVIINDVALYYEVEKIT